LTNHLIVIFGGSGEEPVYKPVTQQKTFRLSVEIVSELKLHVARKQAEA
jgi:hypothetical protein